MNIHHLYIAALLTTSLLMGCLDSSEQTAGGENFPNTFGEILDNNLNTASTWGDEYSIPSNIPVETTPSGAIPTALGKELAISKNNTLSFQPPIFPQIHWPTFSTTPTVLAKSGSILASDTTSTTIILSDASLYIRSYSRLLSTYEESTWVVSKPGPDSGLIIAVHVSTFDAPSKTRTIKKIDDGDSNGIVQAVAGHLNRAIISVITEVLTLDDYSYRHERLIMDAGTDHDFGDKENPATKDNLIVSYSIAHRYKAPLTGTMDSTHQSFEDADGNGYISPVNDEEVLSKMVHYKYINHVSSSEEVVVGPGIDRDYNTQLDNTYHSYQLFRTALSDTLRWVQLTDGDGNGVLWDSTSDSSSVWIEQIDKNRLAGVLRPNRKYFKALVTLFPNDTLKNHPVSYLEKKTWQNGRANETRIKGPNDECVFGVHDTMIIHSNTTFPMGDSIGTQLLTYKVWPGNTSVNSDDKLTYISMSLDLRQGAYKRINFILLPDATLQQGTKPSSGTISMDLISTSGDSTHISGTLTGKKVTGTYTLNGGTPEDFVWNK